MFTDEMQAKIRSYTPPPVSEFEKQKELKRQQKIEKRVEKDAQYLWNKLQELYEKYIPYFAKYNLNGSHPIRFMFGSTRVGTHPHHVYYTIPIYADFGYFLLSRRKIKYPELTFRLLKEIALNNGLDVYFQADTSYQGLSNWFEHYFEHYYTFKFTKNWYPGGKGTFDYHPNSKLYI